MPDALVTTSWDDGCPEDFRIADLLAKYGVPGCFYVPRSNPERPVIDEAAIRRLGAAYEIGGHTLGHRPLTGLPRAEAEREIHDGKRWLDDVLGRATRAFCYPCGMFDEGHARSVAAAGFESARTADWLCLDAGRDLYRLAPSLHLYPHSRFVHVAHCLRRSHLPELARYLRRFRAAERPSTLALAMLDFVEEHGGVFHVWGHGWEIEQRGMWQELEVILAAIGRRPGLIKLDNGTLAARLRDASLRSA